MSTTSVTSSGSSPGFLSGLAQAERYRYFTGLSGQRYIFTKMSVADLEDCRQAVVILLSKPDPRSGERKSDRPVWLGEIDRNGKRHGPRLTRGKLARSNIYVHLLAENAGMRRSILNDLSVPGEEE
jgi:hypothetical protein